MRLARVPVLALLLVSACQTRNTDQPPVSVELQQGSDWAVPYGHEFWKPAAAPGDVGHVIDRVSHAFKTDAATDPRFTVALEKGGFSFIPAGKDKGLRLSTTQVFTESGSLFAPGSPVESWSVLGNVAQHRLGGGNELVEHLQIGASGAELSWIVSARPSGDELSVQVRAEGAGAPRKNGEGVAFGKEGETQFHVTGATVVDSAGAHWSVPLTALTDGFGVVVSKEILETARYPLAIDPTISAEIVLDTVRTMLLPQSYNNFHSSASLNGTTLLLWGYSTSAGPVNATRIDQSGNILDVTGVALPWTNGNSAVKVASNGSEFLLVWTQQQGAFPNNRILGTRMLADFTRLDATPFVIASSATTRNHQTPAVASNGTDFFVVWSDTRNGNANADIFGTPVRAAGTSDNIDGYRISTATNNQLNPAVACTSGQCLTSWEDSRQTSTNGIDVYGAVESIGAPAHDPANFPIRTGQYDQASVVATSNGSNFLVMWTENNNPTTPSTNAKRVQPNGTVLDSVSDAGYPGIQVHSFWLSNLALASDGTDFLAIGSQYANRITAAGTVVDGDGFDYTSGTSFGYGPTVVSWNGNSYVIGFAGYNNYSYLKATRLDGGSAMDVPPKDLVKVAEGENASVVAASSSQYLVAWSTENPDAAAVDVRGARLALDGTVLDPNGLDIGVGLGTQQAPAVSSDGTDFLVAWTDQRAPRGIHGARVLADGGLPDGIGKVLVSRSTTENYPALAWGSNSYLLTWMDPNASSDIYGWLVTKDGTPLQAAPTQISVAGTNARAAVASNGSSWLVAWTWPVNNDIGTAYLAADGGVVNRKFLQTGNDVFQTQKNPAIASNGFDYLLTYRHNPYASGASIDVEAHRFRGDGALVDANPFIINTGFSASEPAVTALSKFEWLVTWGDYRTPANQSDIYGQRLSTSMSKVGPEFIIASTVDNESAAAMASINGTALVSYTRFDTGPGYNANRIRARLVSESATDDVDNDGVQDRLDCNPADAGVSTTGVPEQCGDKIDNDCDGRVDEGDDAVNAVTLYLDRDGDGYGDSSATAQACPGASGFAAVGGDCNDFAAGVHPGATEVCDPSSIDQDCNGLADDADPNTSSSGKTGFYTDGDGDGYGAGTAILRCHAAPGQVSNSTDCNDSNSAVHPGATEVCDPSNTDENCNGQADDADPGATGKVATYADGDGDGYGTGSSVAYCDPPAGRVTQSGDCNDSSSAVHPGATEVCDPSSVDENCNGLADDADPNASGKTSFYADGDSDGYGAGAAILRCHAAAGQVSNNTDCNDAKATVHPGATEVCDSASTDEDCNGQADDADPNATGKTSFYADGDSDGYGAGAAILRCHAAAGQVSNATDCNDSSSAIHPGATEVCDSASTDEDCNGQADDADPNATGKVATYADGDSDGYGTGASTSYCHAPAGRATANGDCNDSNSAIHPGATEVCDSASTDENCNGVADDADPNATGKTSFYADGDSDSYGAGAAILRCHAAAGQVTNASDCNDANAAIHPGATEVCDSASTDEDCNGSADDADPNATGKTSFYADGDSDSYGAGAAILRCHAAAGQVTNATDCNDSNAAIHPGATEVCDSASTDEDCNGLSDDADPAVTGKTNAFTDGDGDGYGAGAAIAFCHAPPGTAPVSGDCDDSSSTTHPGAVDVPGDGIDQDCSGADAIVDAGTPDSGVADAGSVSDAGSVNDAGTSADAGSELDAGSGNDAGSELDAGSGSDAGEIVDAGSPPDGGEEVHLDGGSVDDAGTSEEPAVDAGSETGSVQGKGCGCGATGGGAFAFLLLVPFMRRRRSA